MEGLANVYTAIISTITPLVTAWLWSMVKEKYEEQKLRINTAIAGEQETRREVESLSIALASFKQEALSEIKIIKEKLSSQNKLSEDLQEVKIELARFEERSNMVIKKLENYGKVVIKD